MKLGPTLATLLLSHLSVLPAADALQKSLPLAGAVFQGHGHTAFVMLPPPQSANRPIPWVWYKPTLPALPGNEEQWMFERFNQAGGVIARFSRLCMANSPSIAALRPGQFCSDAAEAD